MPSGTNRKRAGPVSSTTGRKTMQMASVATVSGVTTSPQPSRMATVSGLPSDWLRWMFSMVTVALSTSRPIASASPPSVIRLIDLPGRRTGRRCRRRSTAGSTPTRSACSASCRGRARIISETRIEEITASRTTLLIAERTNTDWSKSSDRSSPLRRRRLDLGHHGARRLHHGRAWRHRRGAAPPCRWRARR